MIQSSLSYEDLHSLTLVSRTSHALFQSFLDPHKPMVQKYNHVTIAQRSSIMSEPDMTVFTGAVNMLRKIRDDDALLPYVKTLNFCPELVLSWSVSWDNPAGAETSKYNRDLIFWHRDDPHGLIDLHREAGSRLTPVMRPGLDDLLESSTGATWGWTDINRTALSTTLLLLTLPALKCIELHASQCVMFLQSCEFLQVLFTQTPWTLRDQAPVSCRI